MPTGHKEVKCEKCQGMGFDWDKKEEKEDGTIIVPKCEECDGSGYKLENATWSVGDTLKYRFTI